MFGLTIFFPTDAVEGFMLDRAWDSQQGVEHTASPSLKILDFLLITTGT